MAKAEQVLVLDPPSELHFKGPFSEVTTTNLLITNPTDRRIGYKVKTTAPKTYCVRPNGGVIYPKNSSKVAVMLQPFDPDLDDRSKDKFMVQSMFIPDGQEYTDNMWHDVPPEGLMNSKLKCIFYPVPEAAELAKSAVDAPKTKGKPTVVPDSKGSDTEKEAKKLSEEFKKLKAELNDLRQENSVLKEEGIRYRMANATKTKGISKSVDPDVLTQKLSSLSKKQQFSNSLIMIAFIILVLGVCIGKYVL